MFTSYDTEAFSNELKKLRKTLGFSLDNVSENTGISISTLKSLEKGKSIPRFDTLSILSSFYKVDLMLTFSKLQNSNTIFKLYENVNKYISKENNDLLIQSLKDVSLALKNENLKPVQVQDLMQVKYFIEGLELVSTQTIYDPSQLSKALSMMVKAIKITTPNFEIEHFEGFRYNAIEYKILFSIASLFLLQRDNELSNKILFFILDFINCTSFVDQYNSALKAKVYSLISYNYHIMDIYEKVIQYANTGISICQNEDTTEYLPLLLARKSIALYNLNDPNWKTYYQKALNLLEIMGKDLLYKTYEEHFSKLVFSGDKKEA